MHVKHVQGKEDSQITLLHFPTTEGTVFRDSIFNTGRNRGWFTTCYMLCDLPADGIYETRGAAMSSTVAATGLVLFLLSLPGNSVIVSQSWGRSQLNCFWLFFTPHHLQHRAVKGLHFQYCNWIQIVEKFFLFIVSTAFNGQIQFSGCFNLGWSFSRETNG